MKLVFAAMCLVGAMGLSKVDAAPPVTLAAPADATSSLSEEAEPSAVRGKCPQAWTCDNTKWYSTEAACNTSCGNGSCYLDYRCTIGCICP
jgi:hypothetical protein